MRIAIDSIRWAYEGWVSVLVAMLRMPSGDLAEQHIVLVRSGAAVLPYDPVRRTALVVSMPRAAVLYRGYSDTIEAIGGALDGDEPEACARREALEEAGVLLRELEHLGRFWPMSAISTAESDYFLAPYSAEDRIAPGGGNAHEHEHVQVHELPLYDLWCMVEDKSLRDSKLHIMLQTLRLRQPELFV